jgi:adenylosuccinate synthase
MSIAKLDVLDDFETIKLCVAYEVDGRQVTQLPARMSELEKAVPVYVEVPGWKTPLRGVRERTKLPSEAVSYLSNVEQALGVPITYVGIGPERDQYLVFSS